MLSQILCSDASPAKWTVRSLPQILHAIWMSRTYSDCSIVSFWIHRPERATRPSGSLLVSCVCVPKLRSCWAATWGGSFVAFSWAWVGILLNRRICARLRFQRHLSSPHSASGSHLDAPPSSLCSRAFCGRLFLAVTAFPLVLLASNLLSSLSLDPPAGALWVTGSQRKSVIVFGNLPPATVRWVRNRINSRNTSRIFTSFHPWDPTGYSCTITPTGCGLYSTVGSPLRWNSLEQGIYRLQSTSSSPLSPETTPVALCQQLTGCLERVQPTSRKHRKKST